MIAARDIAIFAAGAAAAVVGALVFTSTQAKAGSLDGFYVGAGGSYSAALMDTSLDVAGFGSLLNIDSLSADGAGLYGTVGYDRQLPGTAIFIGVFADYTIQGDSEFTISSPLLGGNLVTTEIENSWTVGGRVGVSPIVGTKVYALAGYTQAELADISVPPAGLAFSVPTLKGYVLGGGTEIDLSGGFALQAEYRLSQFDETNVPIVGPISLGLDMDVHLVRLGVVFRPGGIGPDVLRSAPMK